MTAAAAGKHLKAWNLPWLCSLAALDIIGLYFLLFPEAMASTSFSQIGAARLALSTALPVAVILLAAVLPQNVKASLVYWKINHALPGHEAFTKYGPTDSRVDMESLRKNVGALPEDPHEQNALWYKLYRKVGAEIGVMDSHKAFLLFRDMAAISILLAVVVPVTCLFIGVRPIAIWASLALFLIQYFITALAARHSGIRFVGTVLAEHSIRRVTAKPKA